MNTEEAIEGRTGEERNERRARELAELLQELRVMLPGVQVLFAFLLAVSFLARFGEVTPLQQAVFFGTLLCAALSAGLLLAPSAYHRLLWRQQAREHRLRAANRLAIAGMVLLVVAMVGVVFVITDILFGSVVAAVSGFCLADPVPAERQLTNRAASVSEGIGQPAKKQEWPESCMAHDSKTWYYRRWHCTTGRRDGSDGLVGQKPTTLRCCGPGRWSLKRGRQNTPARIFCSHQPSAISFQPKPLGALSCFVVEAGLSTSPFFAVRSTQTLRSLRRRIRLPDSS